MTASRDEILAFLGAELETHRYRDYAPIGLQVIGAERVERVASAVSSTLEVFDRASVEGAQLLLVHHGMFWDNEPRVIGPGALVDVLVTPGAPRSVEQGAASVLFGVTTTETGGVFRDGTRIAP